MGVLVCSLFKRQKWKVSGEEEASILGVKKQF